ncbi:CU044_2847 family protein [Arthrobacter ginkgonis]
MRELVEFRSADGGTVLVEVEEGPGVVTRGGGRGEVFKQAQQTFEEAVSRIQPAVQGVINQMLSLTHRPDEVCVEFGLDLHAQAGAFIAAAGATANFTVTLTWRAAPT